jgi:hypothetical protein
VAQGVAFDGLALFRHEFAHLSTWRRWSSDGADANEKPFGARRD